MIPRLWWILAALSWGGTCFPGVACGNEPTRQQFSVPKDGRLPIVDARVQGDEARLVIDIGSSRSGFDVEWAQRLGAPAGRTKLTTFGREVELPVYAAPSVALGTLAVMPGGSVYVRPFAAERRWFGQRIDGALGSDSFRGKVVELDFDQGHLRVGESEAKPKRAEDAAAQRLSLLLDDEGKPWVMLRLGGRDERFLVNTASNSTSIREALFDELSREGTILTGDKKTIATAGGGVTTVAGYLDFLEFGSTRLPGVHCDRGPVSSLGLRHLSRFVVMLDFAESMAEFRPARRFATHDSRGRSGLSAVPGVGGYRITRVRSGGPADRAGLQRGDTLVSVDGISARDFDPHDLGNRFTSAPGTRIELVVDHLGGESRTTLVVEDRFPQR